MYCSNCGTEIGEATKFCSKCGQRVQGNETDSEGVLHNSSTVIMNAKATSIVAYMSWIGFLIAICLGDKEGAKFYLNQALVFNLFCLPCIIPVVGWMWGVFMLVCFIFGVIWAAEQEQKELPLIGQIKILN